jgi:hypothetical protein
MHSAFVFQTTSPIMPPKKKVHQPSPDRGLSAIASRALSSPAPTSGRNRPTPVDATTVAAIGATYVQGSMWTEIRSVPSFHFCYSS